jgi:hypothetical protein
MYLGRFESCLGLSTYGLSSSLQGCNGGCLFRDGGDIIGDGDLLCSGYLL